ncbi:hypothetical protein EV714DRAFT_266533 [Schizophyllum commune]
MASIEELLESSIANNDLHRSAYVPDDQTAWDIAQKTHALRQLEEQLDESARSTIEERIHAQIALQVALLAPCRRIPPEILSSIFVLAVPDKWDELYVGKRTLYLASIFSDSNAVEVLQHLLDGSLESQLETLNLKYTEPVSSPQLIACLRRLSSLRNLELWSDEFMGRDIIGPLVSEEIIRELTRDDDNPASLTLLPNLSYLRIGCGYVEELMEAKKHCVLKRIYTSRQETNG